VEAKAGFVHNISDKAMRVRMIHCELKWEIPNKRETIVS
jgi:hypothetical protein